jgi:CRP/FNR family transcriptional regulator, cyclic AMP receptor protein
MFFRSKLQKCHLFNGLSDVLLEQLEAGMRWQKLRMDEMLCNKGDAPDGLYVVASGSLVVYDLLHNGQEVALSALGEGAFMGELSVIDQQPRTAYVRANLPSEVGLLPQPEAARLFYQEPVVAQRVMAFLAGKVRDMTLQRLLLGIPGAFDRVCAWLVHASRPGPNGLPMVAMLPRQQDLAGMLNTSRETVSRALARLMRDQVIEKTPSGLRVLQPQVLMRLAHAESWPTNKPASTDLI